MNKELAFDNTFHYINKDFKSEVHEKEKEIIDLKLKV